jgi:hypothetical protein
MSRLCRHRGEAEVWLYSFFNFDARWGWMVNVTPLPLYAPGMTRYPCTRGWVGLRAGLDGCDQSCIPLGFDPGPLKIRTNKTK